MVSNKSAYGKINQFFIFFAFIKKTRCLVSLSKLMFLITLFLTIMNIFNNYLTSYFIKNNNKNLEEIFQKSSRFFDFENDSYLPDYYLSGLYFSVSMILLVTFFSKKEKVFLPFFALNFFIWNATSFRYHDFVSSFLKNAYHLDIQNSYVEFIAWLAVLIILLPYIIYNIRKISPNDYGVVIALSIPFLMLCFFAIFIDYLHEIYSNTYLNFPLMILEESGEILSGSLAFITALAGLLYKHEKQSE